MESAKKDNMRCAINRAALAPLLLLVAATDAFVKPQALRSGSSQLKMHDKCQERPCTLHCAFGVGAAAVMAFNSVNAASAAVPPLPQNSQFVAISSPMTSQQQVRTSSISNIPSQRELLAKSSSLSSGMILSAASTNVADAGATIADINYNGKVPKTEADEYVVVKNGSKNPVDVSGYYIYVATTGTQGPTFYFPKGSIIKPGGTARVYTNEIHKETGGYSYGSGKAIWSNNGGLAVMKDSNGKKICEYKYKPVPAATK